MSRKKLPYGEKVTGTAALLVPELYACPLCASAVTRNDFTVGQMLAVPFFKDGAVHLHDSNTTSGIVTCQAGHNYRVTHTDLHPCPSGCREYVRWKRVDPALGPRSQTDFTPTGPLDNSPPSGSSTCWPL